MTNRVIEFLNEFERISGQKCMIYSYTSFINNNLDYLALLKYKLWVANYGSCRYPSIWQANYSGWQFSESSILVVDYMMQMNLQIKYIWIMPVYK